MACAPLYITDVPAADVQRGDGDLVVKFQEQFCRVTKDGFACNAGELIRFRPWQQNLAGAIYARRPDGRRNHRRALIGLPRKNGKALWTETPVLTDRGWLTMADVKTGDFVHAPDGSYTEVVNTTETMFGRPCYEVCFSNGARLTADAQHEWTVRDRWRDRWLTVTTEEMAGQVNLSGDRIERRYSLRQPSPVERPDLSLPVDPYILGYWLGDGNSASARITIHENDWPSLRQQLEAVGYFYGEPYRRRSSPQTLAICISTQPVRRGGRAGDSLQVRLRSLGILGNKQVPGQYLLSSHSQRLALLQGLLDSDGTVSGYKPKSPRVTFTSTSKPLSDAVLFLARSLGWKASIRAGTAKLDGREIGPVWDVSWTAFRDRSPFRLPRKTARLSEKPERGTRSDTIQVTSITRVPSLPVRCIEVDHPSRQYLAGEALIPTHNSAIGSGFALHGLLTDGDGAEVYGLACDKDQAKIVFNVAKRMVELDPQLSEIVKCYRDVLEIPGAGSIYKALSSEAFSKEGLNPTTVIYDELHAAPNDELYDVMLNAFGARKDPLMIAITTAGVKSDSTGGDSLCYRLYQYGLKLCSGELKDDSFFFAWWGAPENADPSLPATWKMANPGYNDLLDPADFESTYAQHLAKGTIGDFKTKRLTMWVSQVRAWMPEGAWSGCQRQFAFTAPPKGVVLGFDGSRSGDSTALVAVTVEPDPKIIVLGVWEKPTDSSSEWRVPREDVKEAIRQACRDYDVREVAADEFIWVGELEELLEEGIPVVSFPQTMTRMGPATQRFFELVRDRRLSQDGNLPLARHIGNAQLKTDPRGSRLVKDARNSPRKIDLAVAAVMAVDRAGYWLSQDGPGTWNGVPVKQIKFVWLLLRLKYGFHKVAGPGRERFQVDFAEVAFIRPQRPECHPPVPAA